MTSRLKEAARYLAAIGISAAALAAAALPAQADSIRFMGWVGLFDFQKPGWDKIVKEFEAQNPGITIDYIGTPFEDTLNQATTAILGHNAPDIIQSAPGWIPQLNGMGALASFNDLMSADELAKFPKGIIDAVSFDNQVKALPWLPGPIMMGYNRDILQKAGIDGPPKTWDEFKADVDKVCEMGKKDGTNVYGAALRTARGPNSAQWAIPIIWANGGTIQDENGKISFNNDGVKAAFSWYHDVISKGCSPDSFGIQESRNVFGTGRAAFIFEGPWLKGLIDGLSGGKLKVAPDGDVWIAPVPAAADGVVRQLDNGNMLTVTTQAKNPKLAAKFIDFILSNQETVDYFFQTSKQPTSGRMDLLSSGTMGADPWTQEFVKTLPNSNPIPIKDPQWDAMMNQVAPALQAVIKGADPSTELAKVDQAIQDIVDEE